MDLKISRQSSDIILKAAAEVFRGQALEAIGLHVPPVVDMLPTVLPVAEVKEERVDFLFLLVDESLLHLEFQTTARLEDMYRFAGYDLKLAERYRKKIRTAVIYSGRVKEGPEGMDHGSLVYRVTNIYLNRMDGEREYEYIKVKWKEGKSLPGQRW